VTVVAALAAAALTGITSVLADFEEPVDGNGSVNLNAYCIKAYGQNFSAVHVSPGAGGWVCQSNRNRQDRRSISVQAACRDQYFQWGAAVHATAMNDGSWKCTQTILERRVNLTLYCTKHFGTDFAAVLHGPTSGDWSCQRGTNVNDRRPISVYDACTEQWYSVRRAQAVPPNGWECVLNPQYY
jgi:hypothetical protein